MQIFIVVNDQILKNNLASGHTGGVIKQSASSRDSLQSGYLCSHDKNYD